MLQAAHRLAERIRSSLSTTTFSDAGLRVTGSLGVASCLPEDDGYGSVLRRADVALACAKRLGRDRAVVASSLEGAGLPPHPDEVLSREELRRQLAAERGKVKRMEEDLAKARATNKA